MGEINYGPDFMGNNRTVDPMLRPNYGRALRSGEVNQSFLQTDEKDFDILAREKIRESQKAAGRHNPVDPEVFERNERQHKGVSKSLSDLKPEKWIAIIIQTVKHQDPEDPLKAHEIANMMTQMGMATGVASASEKMDNVIERLDRGNMASNTGNIGKYVEADTSHFAFTGEDPVMLGYTLPTNANKVALKIFNEQGRVVRAQEFDPKANPEAQSMVLLGRHDWIWDGKTDANKPVEPGKFRFTVTPLDSAGKPLVDEDSQKRIAANHTVTAKLDSVALEKEGSGEMDLRFSMGGVAISQDQIRGIRNSITREDLSGEDMSDKIAAGIAKYEAAKLQVQDLQQQQQQQSRNPGSAMRSLMGQY